MLQLNARHLTGSNAPDHILFRIETIDGRLPSLDDGMSWPLLLNSYSIEEAIGDYIRLKRKSSATPPQHRVVYEGVHRFAARIDVPSSAEPLFATFDVIPTLRGRAVGTVFKPSPIGILVTFADGRTDQYRVMAGMMRTPFLLSPMITNTGEFMALGRGTTDMDSNRVARVQLVASGEFWRDPFAVQFSTVSSSGTGTSGVSQ